MTPLFLTLYRFLRAIFRGLKDPEFKALLFLTAFILISGMLFYHEVEHWSMLDGLYFSVTTLTTVGFGDLTPHTAGGKIFTIIYIFIGIGVILGFINAVAHHAQTKSPKKGENKKAADLSADETEKQGM